MHVEEDSGPDSSTETLQVWAIRLKPSTPVLPVRLGGEQFHADPASLRCGALLSSQQIVGPPTQKNSILKKWNMELA